ncbi:hypothetical protein GCM10019016_007410 [Streptomyces prasinosporus]|uniref:MarR family transcriptional regulator n=1 Tax=Streptomyces prasinosporus TaxID=68256 RepID=A0ABP6TEK0_9ACTN
MAPTGLPWTHDTDPTPPAATPAEPGTRPRRAVLRDDWLRLDQQICFSLNAAARAFNGVYRVVLKDLGLTYPAVPGDAGAVGTRRAAR